MRRLLPKVIGCPTVILLPNRLLARRARVASLGFWAKSRYAPAATIPADKELYQRQIEATDRQIEALVYELYGLGEDEIGVVERRNH